MLVRTFNGTFGVIILDPLCLFTQSICKDFGLICEQALVKALPAVLTILLKAAGLQCKPLHDSFKAYTDFIGTLSNVGVKDKE